MLTLRVAEKWTASMLGVTCARILPQKILKGADVGTVARGFGRESDFGHVALALSVRVCWRLLR